jgi:hypothetical protein
MQTDGSATSGRMTPERALAEARRMIAAGTTIGVMRRQPDGSIARVAVPLADVTRPELDEYIRWRKSRANR